MFCLRLDFPAGESTRRSSPPPQLSTFGELHFAPLFVRLTGSASPLRCEGRRLAMSKLIVAREAFQGFSLPTCPVCRDGAMQPEEKRTNMTVAACFTCGSTLTISHDSLQRFLPRSRAATNIRGVGRL